MPMMLLAMFVSYDDFENQQKSVPGPSLVGGVKGSHGQRSSQMITNEILSSYNTVFLFVLSFSCLLLQLGFRKCS